MSETDLIGELIGLIDRGVYANLGPMATALKQQVKCYKWLHAPLTAILAMRCFFF